MFVLIEGTFTLSKISAKSPQVVFQVSCFLEFQKKTGYINRNRNNGIEENYEKYIILDLRED